MESLPTRLPVQRRAWEEAGGGCRGPSAASAWSCPCSYHKWTGLTRLTVAQSQAKQTQDLPVSSGQIINVLHLEEPGHQKESLEDCEIILALFGGNDERTVSIHVALANQS